MTPTPPPEPTSSMFVWECNADRCFRQDDNRDWHTIAMTGNAGVMPIVARNEETARKFEALAREHSDHLGGEARLARYDLAEVLP